jgi:hypothetical protein
MFYKVALNYPVVLESTTALEGDVTAWVKAESLRLSLPLDPSQRTCSFTLRNASSLGVDPNTLHNRLVSVQIDGNEIFRGTVMPPIIRRIQGGVDVVEFTLHDQWHRFSHTILPNSRAYDGWDATVAIGDLLEKAGLQVRDGGDFSFQSGSEGGQCLETGEVYLVKGTGKLAQSLRDEQDLYRPQMGSSVAEVLTHIKENYFAHDWIHGFRPVYSNGVSSVKYCLYPKPSEPMAVLYIDRLSASANFGDFVAMGVWVETHSEPEANELWVIGQDPDGYAIVASQFNAFSQLPSYSDAISAGLHPGLWLGERRLILRFDNSLNTQADADFVCGLLWNAAFREKTRARVKATYRPSINGQTIDLQPGDVIEIQGKQGLWRILSMEIDLDYIRPGNSIAFCEYEIELVSGDSMQEEQQG